MDQITHLNEISVAIVSLGILVGGLVYGIYRIVAHVMAMGKPEVEPEIDPVHTRIFDTPDGITSTIEAVKDTTTIVTGKQSQR